MLIRYQIIIIGKKSLYTNEILDIFYKRLNELGIKKESIIIIDKDNFHSEYKANAPTFCLYFGNKASPFKDLDLVRILIVDATLILPIVDDFINFSSLIPEELLNINGFELSSSVQIEKLVSSILEGLSLLRLSRRLFISYKRNEV